MILDSFLIALGFKVDPSGAAALKKQTDSAKDNLLSLGNAVKAFATGFVVKSIADINSSFEQNRFQIAGFLNALDLSPNFTKGLEDASDIIAQINKDAAKLPGEAEEYVEVFKTNAAYLKSGIPGANASDIAAFTNRLTAVAKTVASTMDAGQIGRESGMLLATEGRAGSHNVLWTKLLPILMQVDGQAKITAQSFNAMTQPQRVELLNKAFDKLQPAIDAASDSFDAMWGAAVSGVKQFVRAATPGVFKAMKEGLQTVTGFFINDAGKLTANGQMISDILQKVGYGIVRMIRLGGIAAKAFLKLAGGSIELKLGLVGLIGAVIGFQKVLRFGLLGAMLLIIEDLHTFYNGGQSITGMLVHEWPNALAVIQGVLLALGAAFGFVQGRAITAAIATGAAWAAANAPFIIIIASVGALIYAFTQLITKWEKVKATAKGWVNIAGGKLLDALGAPAPNNALSNESAARLKMGAAMDQIDFEKNGRLDPGHLGPAYRPGLGSQDPSAGTWSSSLGSSTASPNARFAAAYEAGNVVKWDPSMGGTASHPTVNTTINVNGAGDPKAVAAEVVRVQERQNRAAIRSSQKAHGY